MVPLSTIELDFFDDSAAAAAAFDGGGYDAASGLLPQGVDAAAKVSGSHVTAFDWSSLVSVVVNQRSSHKELQDQDVRAALLAAVDRSSLVGDVLLGHGTVADAPLPPWSPSYDATAVTPVAYDAVAAGSKLAAAGWIRTTSGWAAPGSSAAYSMHILSPAQDANPILYATAKAVAAAWTALGLNVTLDVAPVTTYLARLDSGDFTTAVVDFEVGLDPDLGPLLLSSQVGSGGSNVSGVQDQTLDGLLQVARKTVDPVARQVAVSAVERYVSTTVPILPLMFRDYDLVVASRLRNVYGVDIADPSNRFWDVVDWRLASDG